MGKAEAARQALLDSSKNKKRTTKIHCWPVDMASYASVQAFASRMARDLDRVDALVLNAGISTHEYTAAEGLESTLTINVVSTFLLALLAMPQLQNTTARFGAPTHLTVIGSMIHCFADHTQLQNPREGELFSTLSDKSQADMAGRYFLTKLMVLLVVRELAERIPQSGKKGGARPQVILTCPNPGWYKTALFRQDDGGVFARNILKLIGRTAEVGARTLTHAIAADQAAHGQYLSECRVKSASVFVRSPEGQKVQKRVWTELVEMLESIAPGIQQNLS